MGRNSTNHIQPLISWEVPTAKGRFRGINQTNICCNKPSLLLNPPQPSLYKGGSSSPDKGRLGGVPPTQTSAATSLFSKFWLVQFAVPPLQFFGQWQIRNWRFWFVQLIVAYELIMNEFVPMPKTFACFLH